MNNFPKIKTALLFTAVTLLFGSCIRDVAAPEPDGTGTVEISDAITLRIAVPAPPQASRALTAEHEYAVEKITVLAFNTDKTLKGRYAGVPGTLTPGAGASATLDFEVTLPAGTYDLMVVANGDWLLDAASAAIVPHAQQSAVEAAVKMSMTTSGWNTNPAASDYKKMPMWGYVKSVNIAHTDDFTASSGKNRFKRTIYLARMVAKVDVALDETLAAAMISANKKFELQSVRVYNYSKDGYLIPDTGGTFDWALTNATSLGYDNNQTPRVPANVRANNASEFIDRTLTTGATALEGEIYLFEAEAGTPPVNSSAGEAYKSNICLVIGGKYNGGTKSFYRIDFVRSNGTYLPILRNNSYSVTITDITGDGHPDEKTALESIPANIEAEILDWNGEGIKEVTSNGVYMLGVSQSRFGFSRAQRTATSDDNTLLVTTDYHDGWKAVIVGNKVVNGTDTPDATTSSASTAARTWLSLSVSTGNGNHPAGNSVRIQTTENTSGSDRTGWIRITAGTLVYNVKVTQTTVASLRVWITDLQGNHIDKLSFAANNGTANSAPAEQYFAVKWSPGNLPVSISKMQPSGSADIFTWQNVDNDLTTLPPGSSSATENGKTFSVNPTAISNSTPFYNRGVLITFLLSDAAGENATAASITLTQGNQITNITPALTVSPASSGNYSYLGETRAINITSRATGKLMPGGTTISNSPVAWKAEFRESGTTTWSATPPSWLAFPTSGPGSASATPHNAVVSAFNINTNSPEDNLLRQATPPAASPFDLSRGGATANCYVVNAPGHYSLPLVYGNARKADGTTNTAAYDPTVTGSYVLAAFLNHADAAITGPNIAGADGATLVWQDSPGLIDKSSVKLANGVLEFKIPQQTIAQGNAIVAVRQGSTILWSWHIWVTPSSIFNANLPASGNTTYNGSVNSVNYKWMNCNIGWVKGRTTNYGSASDDRSVDVRISQTGISQPATPVVYTINQPHGESYTRGNNTFYQWGRKDPLPPSNGGVSATNTNVNDASGDDIDKPLDWGTGFGPAYEKSGQATLGAAIQNPHLMYLGSSNWNSTNYYNLWDANRVNTSTTATTTATRSVKTIYDPSPVGFKVPEYSATTSFSTSNGTWTAWANATDGNQAGYRFFNSVGMDFPASGYRNYSGGSLGTVGTGGYYWSALPGSTTYGYCLYFGSGSVYMGHTNRSNGFSVRPVAE